MKFTMKFTMKKVTLLLTLGLSFVLLSCSTPVAGPDKTIGGAVLGAAWGAGAGAVVGNQLNGTGQAGEGAAVGAGLGMIAGAMSGLMYDSIEERHIQQEKRLASLKIQNIANGNQLAHVQAHLDSEHNGEVQTGVYHVYFDVDQTNLRAGGIANLETIADNIKRQPPGFTVHVVGHTDNTGNQSYNERLALARAEAVSSYIGARGLDVSTVAVSGQGAKQPVATNATAEGRQLNRRVDVFVKRN